MEYNTNTYLTLSHSDCDTLNLGNGLRTNNAGDTCIIEFEQGQEIPAEIQSVVIGTYTHEEALTLVSTEEWVSQLPM
jgi:hypothetical protein